MVIRLIPTPFISVILIFLLDQSWDDLTGIKAVPFSKYLNCTWGKKWTKLSLASFWFSVLLPFKPKPGGLKLAVLVQVMWNREMISWVSLVVLVMKIMPNEVTCVAHQIDVDVRYKCLFWFSSLICLLQYFALRDVMYGDIFIRPNIHKIIETVFIFHSIYDSMSI